MLQKDSFDRFWKPIAPIQAEYTFDTRPGLSREQRRNKMLKQYFIEDYVRKLKERFSERKKIQEAVFDRLKLELTGTKELLDLFSGMPNVVLPLLEDGVIQQLTLLDFAPEDVVTHTRAQMLKQLSSRKRDKVVNLKKPIVPGTLGLPASAVATFIESGLTLPTRNRFDPSVVPVYVEGQDWVQASYLRSGHIVNTTVTLQDVLCALRQVSQRTLHVFDTPFVAAPLSTDAHRQYVESFTNQVPGWNIEKWTPLFEGSPSNYGVLTYRE